MGLHKVCKAFEHFALHPTAYLWMGPSEVSLRWMTTPMMAQRQCVDFLPINGALVWQVTWAAPCLGLMMALRSAFLANAMGIGVACIGGVTVQIYVSKGGTSDAHCAWAVPSSVQQ